jgi:hypothetical protein
MTHRNRWVYFLKMGGSFHGYVRSLGSPRLQVGDGGIFMDQVSPAWKVSSRSRVSRLDFWQCDTTSQLLGADWNQFSWEWKIIPTGRTLIVQRGWYTTSQIDR